MSEESSEVEERKDVPATRYRVAYTAHAQASLEDLDPALRNSVMEEAHRVSLVNPYGHGVAMDGVRDRRRIVLDGVNITFWVTDIMNDVVEERVLTVTGVTREPTPEPVIHASGSFDDEDEEGDEKEETEAPLSAPPCRKAISEGTP